MARVSPLRQLLSAVLEGAPDCYEVVVKVVMTTM